MNRLFPSALSFIGLIIPLVCVGMKLPIWCNKSWIYCRLQLANERERAAIQAVVEATQMAEIADKATKAIERERKFRASSVQAKKIAVRALEQERKCRIALILSWFFFLFWLCCFHVLAQVRILE